MRQAPRGRVPQGVPACEPRGAVAVMSPRSEKAASPKRGQVPSAIAAESVSPEPRIRRTREETTEAILDAAEDLFSRGDPCAVTVRQIAEKAGVTHPLVHQYVGSKSDIVDAVVKRGAPRRHEIIEEIGDYRRVMTALFADVVMRRVHTRAVVRSAMDGIEYAPLSDRLKSGEMLLELVEEAVTQTPVRPRPPAKVDPRIALAACTALAYGWVATQDWLIQMFDLQDQTPAQIDAQLQEVGMCVADLVFPLSEDAARDDG